MHDIYLTLAEGYEKLAAGYRALAKDQKDENGATPDPAAQTEPERKPIAIEDVRACLLYTSISCSGLADKSICLLVNSL